MEKYISKYMMIVYIQIYSIILCS